ncbi:uncharacterized protein LOC5572897 [Aedes aegypti]|uniref:Uncharacterized protein n=1 Tax=Aedes aegypti TaxID=7159 RepID=A0A1S4FPP9_AEDAE|nr:uncharacterized protein LOC5572897 [Aedes aegypti]
MKLWLTVACVLGFFSGDVFTAYTSISIGTQGLNAMAASLKSIGTVLNAYYKNFNNARNKVLPTMNNIEEYVNTTYKALNDSYGATQPNMVSMMTSVEWFGKNFYYGEQQVVSAMGYDLSNQNEGLRQTMQNIMQTYSSLVSSMSYQQNAELCIEQIAAEAGVVPEQLAKFGICLQAEVDTVPTLVAPLLDIFKLVKTDLVAFNKQLKICAATSTTCINEYFSNIYMELGNINMELYMAASLLQNYQYGFNERNQACGELIRYNVQDISQNLMQKMSYCMYPPML